MTLRTNELLVDRVIDEMPVVEQLVHLLKTGGYGLPDDCLAFGVQHLMPQSLALCWALNELGLRYDRIALCGKPYSTDAKVVRALRRLGVMVVAPRAYELGKSQMEEQVADLDRLAGEFANRKSAYRNPSIIVIDDGGHALTRFDRFVSPPYSVAGLEQTASGFWQVGARSVPFPIVDVGASAIKRICEPKLIVEAALNRALSYLPEEKGLKCGIVGMGFIGQALAQALTDRGASLYVYDVRQDAKIAVPARRAASIRELFERSSVIFGCSGNDSTVDLIDSSKFVPLSAGKRTLISLSSGDVEFFALKTAILQEQGRLDQQYRLGSIPDICGNFQEANFEIVRNGFPVNFDNDRQSVSLEKIQGTIAALIGAALQAFSYTAHSPVGIHSSSRVILDASLQKWLYGVWQPLVDQAADPDFDADVVAMSQFRTDPVSVDLGINFPRISNHLELGAQPHS